MQDRIYVRDILSQELEEDFFSFDLTEIQNVLATLQSEDPFDLAHAEYLSQKSLRGADILSEYLGRIVKTVSYLDAKVNKVKNKAALDYKSPDGKTTADMKKYAAESDPEVEIWVEKLSKAKAVKTVLDKKYELLLKFHHHTKDIASAFRKGILGYSNPTNPDDTNSQEEVWPEIKYGK